MASIGSIFAMRSIRFDQTAIPRKCCVDFISVCKFLYTGWPFGETMNAHAMVEIRKARYVSRLGALGKHNNTNIELHASIHACMYIYMGIYIYVYVYTLYKYIYIYICIYTWSSLEISFFGLHRPTRQSEACFVGPLGHCLASGGPSPTGYREQGPTSPAHDSKIDTGIKPCIDRVQNGNNDQQTHVHSS